MLRYVSRWTMFLLILLSFSMVAGQSDGTFTTIDGNLSLTLPDGWVGQDSGQQFAYIANSADALGQMQPPNGVSMLIMYTESTGGRAFLEGTGVPLGDGLDPFTTAIANDFGDGTYTTETIGNASANRIETAPQTLFTLQSDTAGLVLIFVIGNERESLEDDILQIIGGLAGASAEAEPTPDVATIEEPASTDEDAPEDCSAFALVSDRAAPFQAVEVANVPDSLYDQDVTVTLTTDSGLAMQTTLYGNNDMDVVAVPPHPETPMTGGTYTLTVTDTNGADVCPPQTVTVEGLPTADGATAETVALMGEWLMAQRDLYEVELDTLRYDSPAPLEPELVSLAISQYHYDDPANPDSLVRIVDGTAPIVNDPDFDMALLDAMIAASGLADAMANDLQIVTASVPSRGAGLSKMLAFQSECFTSYPKIVYQVEVPDYYALDCYMGLADSADFVTNPDSLGSEHAANLGLGISSIGNLPGGAGSAAAKAAGPLGVVYMGLMTQAGAQAGLLPSIVENERIELRRGILYEDDDTVVNYDVYVDARSRTWDTTGGFVDATLGVLNSPFNPLKAVSVLDKIPGGVTTAGDLGIHFAGRAGKVATDALTLGPYTWTKIPIDPFVLENARVFGSPEAVQSVEIYSIEGLTPRNETTSILEVTIPFEAHPPVKPTLEVTVPPILINMEPLGPIIAEPNEIVCVTADVFRALDKKGQWEFVGPDSSYYDTRPVETTPAEYCFTPDEPDNEVDEFTCAMFPDEYFINFYADADNGPRNRSANASWETRVEQVRVVVFASEDNPNAGCDYEIPTGNWLFELGTVGGSCPAPIDVPDILPNTVNLTNADGGDNLIGASAIIGEGDNMTLTFTPTAGDNDDYDYSTTLTETFDGVTISVELKLYLFPQDPETAILIADYYMADVFAAIDDAAIQAGGLEACRNTDDATFSAVYDGTYYGF